MDVFVYCRKMKVCLQSTVINQIGHHKNGPNPNNSFIVSHMNCTNKAPLLFFFHGLDYLTSVDNDMNISDLNVANFVLHSMVSVSDNASRFAIHFPVATLYTQVCALQVLEETVNIYSKVYYIVRVTGLLNSELFLKIYFCYKIIQVQIKTL